MANVRALLRLAWRSTVARSAGYTLGAALYFVFASATIVAVFAKDRPFWDVLRDGVLANTLAIAGFVVALFVDELRATPARMRKSVVRGGLEFAPHIRENDALERAAMVLKGSLEGYRAMRATGTGPQQEAAMQLLGADFESFGAIAVNGSVLHGSWRRRRRARRIFKQFRNSYADAAEELFAVIGAFAAEY